MTKNNGNQSFIPFLKWAGGKRWLIPKLSEIIPEQYNRYIEPFLGGGAVYFSIKPSNAILGDINQELIDTYEAIKINWRSVVSTLGKHNKYHCKDYYYKVRSNLPKSQVGRAARFIYLNRTCWNGLYRVNLNGEFNVPIGTKTAVFLPTDNFKQISELLNTPALECADFEDTIKKAGEDDFVFIDPPYTVKHNKNNFIKYNEKLFSWDDQIRLRDAVIEATNRGAKVVVMNAHHDLIKELYSAFRRQKVLSRANVLAADPCFRGKYDEMAIQCWK